MLDQSRFEGGYGLLELDGEAEWEGEHHVVIVRHAPRDGSLDSALLIAGRETEHGKDAMAGVERRSARNHQTSRAHVAAHAPELPFRDLERHRKPDGVPHVGAPIFR